MISALEVITVFLILLIILSGSRSGLYSFIQLPFFRWYVWFIYFSSLSMVFSFWHGITLFYALYEFKGFLLYPLIALILWVGIRSRQSLQLAVLLPVIWYFFLAIQGVVEYRTSVSGGLDMVRINANYAAINLFGITLASFSLFVIAIASQYPAKRIRLIGPILAVGLLVGSLTAVARTVWVALSFGLLLLALFGKGRYRWWLIGGMAIIGVSILIWNPENIIWRILQTDDSSSLARLDYLVSGWEAFKANWVIGAGWGNGMWLVNGRLISSNFIPWYHNDYLNLAVQVGALGLILYLGYWVVLMRNGLRWLRRAASSPETAIALGALLGLVGLLVSAGFEHVLWRPDIGPLTGWFSGILLVAMRLGMVKNSKRNA